MGNDTAVSSDAASAIPSHRLLLLMQEGEDRRLLETWLAERYTIAVASSPEECPEEFDLCILDQSAFARHADAVREWKERTAPTFLPALLLLDEQKVATVNQRVWEHVDELVSTPISKVELRGRLTGLLARRELSKALAERERRVRRILQTIPDPLLILDESGTIVETNPALEAYASFGKGSLEGRQIATIEAFPPETVATLTRLAGHESESGAVPESTGEEGERAANEGTSTADEGGQTHEDATITYRSADGTIRYAEVGVASLDDQPDATEQTLFVLRDVTDRRTRELELERERDRLDNFADMLAHEVRNPLNIAQGFLEQITVEEASERDALDRVCAAHTRMEQMTTELLTHVRGSPLEERRTVNLGQVARVAWGQTPTAGATLEVVDEELTIDADPEGLQTILENLFRNAIDYAGEEATVWIGPLSDGGFYVEDDGPGIETTDREAVFERGFTIGSAGTGLGLALVREIANAHDWNVCVSEGREGGARFEFCEQS